MEKTMKALVKAQPKEGLWLEEVPVPHYGNNDLLVKVKKTAICGTDLHIYNWDAWSQKNIQVPRIIGHEFVGEIVAIGEDVEGFKVGDRVSAEGHITCGLCRSCLAGKFHLCTNTQGIGIQRNGCFAEYVAFPAKNGVHLKEEITDDLAAIFDPFGNAVHTALSCNMVGEDVLITGAGPIGIMACAICRHIGARYIIVTDVQDYRLDLAKQMGATKTINVTKTSVEEAIEDLDMSAFDVGLEMSGSGAAFDSMIRNMHHGGRIALLGILPNTAQIPWDDFIFKGLEMKGIYGREIFETWYKMQTMIQSGLDITKVITHKFPFDDFQKGFDIMNEGLCGKVILEFE